ncbi:PREDICTED: ER degradation-enhancing alpha-mannosidase-like protein 3 isoform X2 [Bactrocera latifrons]|uniref:alpha-1,2-Mannosidase n=2 Tax=Bactrocera latifrons TaxID=174628 RepID=A0A0K8WJT9_BACLA|nr:PREDICTED: ER degradation-enhancing alpha-mannosidase-like protein 3 isoform X2 [Bactrocera latifrons]XP_018782735.1 PREDICTED: ER degradation-enhancing alpha-mannosidase-like protein 3 isoform X2 [Bactrocera latifrons]
MSSYLKFNMNMKNLSIYLNYNVIGLSILALTSFVTLTLSESIPTQNMSRKERVELRNEAKDMFYHAYRAYMDNAYPADELMPLSCKGRYRGVTPSRGDMDDILGNFSMTLVDSIDTLVLLEDFDEFERAVRLVIQDVQFDSDIIVSVFETNIRMVGGLLSAHVLAEHIQKSRGIMLWYSGEMLEMARDLGYRLLPAFNTSTGIPHARVNLRHGIKDEQLKKSRETCTACAGTILLEFAALSRLSGDPVFEARAHKAMDALWKLRHRGSDLMGTVLNIHSGDWVRRDSGVGAGIDSYYEYLFKSYVLLGDDKYLARFNRHYNAVMKYVSEGPMLLDVLMHRPHAKSRNFMDSLLAFWPGLQVLSGDIKPAVQTHEMLYQVMQMHTFIPEAFTVDFQIHWGQHHLRPEFIESTYFLFRATGDHHYLQVGKKALKTLQKYAKVPCGYAAVNDVRTGKHEDRMDSFVLSETFKYLYLLFSEPHDLVVDVDEFVFTTEAHLLPLTIAQLGNTTFSFRQTDEHNVLDFMRTCPKSNKLFPEKVRKPLRNFITGSCPRVPTGKRLRALDFQASNADHLRSIYDMGITMVSLGDGKVRLFHSFYNAKSPDDGEMGLLFMQEMLELTKIQNMNQLAQLQAVAYSPNDKSNDWTALMAGPSHFSPELMGDRFVEGELVMAAPFRACEETSNKAEISGKILIAERGDCTFVSKARLAQAAGALALIVCDNVPGSSGETQPMFAMSGDGTNDVTIPVVFMYSQEFIKLSNVMKEKPKLIVRIMQMIEFKRWQLTRDSTKTTTNYQMTINTKLSKATSTKNGDAERTAEIDNIKEDL